MDISRLIPFIKEAAITVSPEEVAAQLQKQQQSKQEDKQRETVDNEVIEQDERPEDDQFNEEGQLLEGSFKELEVEDAIEQAKEQKLLVSNEAMPQQKLGTLLFEYCQVIKQASCWEQLRKRIR